tara:strand:+ start:1049 stop:1240 length:192 start_codon:yes stop_codon:yes gene_type:complete
MTTTKFKNWKTTKNKNIANKVLERLKKTYPNLNFEIFERQWLDKDKKSYTIRTVTRKGGKRNA